MNQIISLLETILYQVVYLDNLHLEVRQLDQERESELGNRHSKDGKESVECHCIIQ